VAVLSDWRDAALILLILEVLLPGMAVGLVLYQTLRGLAQLRQKLLPWLFQARLVTWRVCERIKHIARMLAAPLIWLHSLAAGIRQALQVLGWR